MYRIPGKRFNIIVDFPWESEIAISLQLERAGGVIEERWEMPMKKGTLQRWGHLVGAAKFFLKQILAQ